MAKTKRNKSERGTLITLPSSYEQPRMDAPPEQQEGHEFASLLGIPEHAGSYPVSFCVVTCDDDMMMLQSLMRTLPPNAEMNILVTRRCNADNPEPHVTDAVQDTVGVFVRRSAVMYYNEPVLNFAVARNVCQQMATKDWCMWLDSDEQLVAGQHGLIEELVTRESSQGVGGFFGQQVSLSTAPILCGTAAEPEYVATKQLRIYRRAAGTWRNEIHEQITQSIIDRGYTVQYSHVVIVHYGYDLQRDRYLAKINRNLHGLIQMRAATTWDKLTTGEQVAYEGMLREHLSIKNLLEK